jgi:hypothetical protein
MTKQCTKCCEVKDISAFRFVRKSKCCSQCKSPKKWEGHNSWCKDCEKEDQIRRKRLKLGYFGKKLFKCFQCEREFRNSPDNWKPNKFCSVKCKWAYWGLRFRANGKTRKSRRPLKKWATENLNKAVRRGTIKKQPCEICGVFPAEAHHEDYNFPLDVRWLCRKCHMARHREINPHEPRFRFPASRNERIFGSKLK